MWTDFQRTYFNQEYEDDRIQRLQHQTREMRDPMIYVGIGIAKLNHFASVVSFDGEVLVEPFEFSNDTEGFRSLFLVRDHFEWDNLLIGLELTIHYGNNFIEFLFSKGYRFCILNPIQIATLARASSMFSF